MLQQSKKATIDDTDGKKRNILHIAASKGHFQFLEVVIYFIVKRMKDHRIWQNVLKTCKI